MIHMCSALMLVVSVLEDVRKQKIYVFPIFVLCIIGILFKIGSSDFSLVLLLKGGLPGFVSFFVSKLCGDCIGKGDSILVLCIGLLEGIDFCMRFIGITSVCIFCFSVIMLGIGKLHRKSQVACVPFLMIGYLGAWLI